MTTEDSPALERAPEGRVHEAAITKVVRSGDTHRIDVGSRLDDLGRFVRLVDGRIDDVRLAPARGVLARSSDRLRLSLDHTVVAFAGATGTGKSSMFNALVGIGLSPVGVRRPTTVGAIACVWDPRGVDGARRLLDRLEVPDRNRLTRTSALDRPVVAGDELAGLILLDLPDFDSAVRNHRLEVDRLVDLADVVVWVTDPQKYADATWHERYLSALTHHAEVLVVVLNQIDKLSPESLGACVGDLVKLLEEDGLAGVEVLAGSIRTGAGLVELRQLLAGKVAGKRAVATRLAADIDLVVSELADDVLGPASDGSPGGDQPGTVPPAAVDLFVDHLAAAAGVSAVGELVEETYVRRARRVGGWVVPQIISSLRSGARSLVADGLAREAAEPGAPPVDQTAVRAAVRSFVTEVSSDLPEPWVASVTRLGLDAATELGSEMDVALAGSEVGPDLMPLWWSVAQGVQWVLALAGVAGVSGLIAQLAFWHHITLPMAGAIPLPALLVVVGAGGGWLLGVAAVRVARVGAVRLRRRVEAAMRKRIDALARERVSTVVEAELDRYLEARSTYLQLR